MYDALDTTCTGPSPLERDVEFAAARQNEFTLSMIAHEISAPIGAVHGLADLLDARWRHQMPGGAIPLWNSVHKETARLHGLVDGLLELLKIRHAPVRRDLVDLDDLVARVIQRMRDDYPDTPVSVEPLGFVHGDERLLDCLWRNLISNALKYSRRAAAPRVHVRGRPAGHAGCVEFSVTDNGIGIPVELRESVFTPFQRSPLARGFEGHGLGLSVVRSIAEAHDGHAWVAPTEAGTEICFSMRGTSLAG